MYRNGMSSRQKRQHDAKAKVPKDVEEEYAKGMKPKAKSKAKYKAKK